MKTKKSFSVKMFFEIKATGKVIGKKSINNCKMIEERIILVQAFDFDDAFKKAEKEGKKYEEVDEQEVNEEDKDNMKLGKKMKKFLKDLKK